MAQQFRILYQDDDLVSIDKPAGYQVHPPENPAFAISPSTNCLRILSRQLDRYLYPVHRLDRATSGTLVYALSSEMAGALQKRFQNGGVRKTYFAVVRGWTEDSGLIDYPLQAEEDPIPKDAITRYTTLRRIDLPVPIGKFPSSRYSLVQVTPETGRYHQIRRHFAHLSHPLIGDSAHGDGKHNRFFREKLGSNALLLKAYSLSFEHPRTGSPLQICSRWTGQWHRVFDLFGICPYAPAYPTGSELNSG